MEWVQPTALTDKDDDDGNDDERLEEEDEDEEEEEDEDVFENENTADLTEKVQEKLKYNKPIVAFLLAVAEYDDVGYGVQAVTEIPINQIVCEYIGVQLSDDQLHIRAMEWRQTRNLAKGPPDAYVYSYEKRVYNPSTGRYKKVKEHIDATTDDDCSVHCRLSAFSYAPFINHSRLHANLMSRVVEFEGQHRILFFSIRDIKAGEQLLFNYGTTDKELLRTYPWLAK